MSADTILFGGIIRTLDPRRPVAEALAVTGGRVSAVGPRAEIEALGGPATRRIDLAGRTAIPGFNDAHVHVWKIGQLRSTVMDLREAASMEALERAVRERAARVPRGEWILGRGWNEAALGGAPTRAMLDRLAPDHPVLLTRTCAHVHVANSAALARAGVNAGTPVPAGGALDLDSGRIAETAHGLLQRAIPRPARADHEAWILEGARHLRSLGITSATDAAVEPDIEAAYRALADAGRLPLRVNLLHLLRPDLGGPPFPLPPPYATDTLRCDTVKLFADGGLSGATAAVSRPYRDPAGSRGILRLEADEMVELGQAAHAAGYRLATHAIGDRAIDATLVAYRRLQQDGALHGRPRVEHCGLPTPAQVAEARALEVHVVTQPVFLAELGGNFRRALAPEDLSRCYPLASLHAAGIPLAFSSDGPVVRAVSPLAGLAAAARHPLVEEESLTVEAALAAYTRGGAAAQGDEDNRGMLRPGMWADIAVLDRDPLEAPAAELAAVRCQATLVGGEPETGDDR